MGAWDTGGRARVVGCERMGCTRAIGARRPGTSIRNSTRQGVVGRRCAGVVGQLGEGAQV